METEIGIKQENLAEVAHSLNVLLADEHVLYIKTRNAHWNVEGPNFHSQHLFFESQYHQVEGIIDDVAERIRTLGHYADATLDSFLRLTHLSEQGRQKNDSSGFMEELLEDHEAIIIYLRENINRYADDLHDLGTSDFITGLAEVHEKMAWKLRAHLK